MISIEKHKKFGVDFNFETARLILDEEYNSYHVARRGWLDADEEGILKNPKMIRKDGRRAYEEKLSDDLFWTYPGGGIGKVWGDEVELTDEDLHATDWVAVIWGTDCPAGEPGIPGSAGLPEGKDR